MKNSLFCVQWKFVPAACVFGSSWTDWHRIFSRTKPNESTDYMICLSAYGAIIGAWFGTWPMALDWESPWQVCYLIAKDSRFFDILDIDGQEDMTLLTSSLTMTF